mgnify:CR=1 FL=1
MKVHYGKTPATGSGSSSSKSGAAQSTDNGVGGLRAAAESGSQPSALALGMRLLLGEGCTADPVAATEMLRLAAGPHAGGQLSLTLFSQPGPGSDSDSDSDGDFVVRGSARGFVAAGPSSPVAAASPPQPSAGPPPAEGRTTPGDGTAVSDGASPIAPIPAEMYEETLRAAQSGDAAAQNDLGVMLHSGASPGGFDSPAAKQWFTKAAAQGSPEAHVNLAFMHVTGAVADRVDLPAALACLQSAAAAGNAAGMNDLGVMLQHGYGCDANPAAAVAWFHRAAELGSVDAAVNAGVAVATGRGCHANPAEGEKMLRKAAETGHVGAARALQELHPQFTSPMRPLRFSALDTSGAATATVQAEAAPAIPAAAVRSATLSPASTVSQDCSSPGSTGHTPSWAEAEERHILRMVRDGIFANLAAGRVEKPSRNVQQLLDEKQILRNLPWMEIAHQMPHRSGKRANAKKCRAYFERVLAQNLGRVALRITLADGMEQGMRIDVFEPQLAQ